MTYKIEKGILIPPHYRGGAKRKYPFDEMQMGDSFLVLCEKEKAKDVSATLKGSSKRMYPTLFTTRYISEEGGVRIWRIA